MNTRGWDSSRLLPSRKGVGILRPDGEAAAGADVLAMMVRTEAMIDAVTLAQSLYDHRHGRNGAVGDVTGIGHRHGSNCHQSPGSP